MNSHFASLVVGLAHQAEQAMSGILPAGAEAGSQSSRQVAQVLIDTLGMLETKTAGHLDPDETKLLREALTALRFQFVQTEKK